MIADSTMPPLLRVENYGLHHYKPAGSTVILSRMGFALGRGEVLGIIGESGAGKSTIGNAILGLLGPGFRQTSGSITFDGRRIDQEAGRAGLRGHRIAAIFQDHTASLDPLMRVGAQIEETVLATHRGISRRQARLRVLDLMGKVGIADPQTRFRHYPHQFSGGQRQRLVIAIALAGSPDIIIADEPTSALDATVQKQILVLLRDLVADTGVSIILVTHDMGVIAEVTDRVLVMRRGEIIEQGRTATVLDHPAHDYTRALLAAVPRLRRHQVLTEDGGSSGAQQEMGGDSRTAILVTEGIGRRFEAPGSRWWRNDGSGGASGGFRLRDVDLVLERATITAIVGESGSGKTTVGRIVAGLETAETGVITIDGVAFDPTLTGRRSGLLGRVQMIFQDPAVSLNPRMTIGETLRESIRFGAQAPDGGRGRAADDLHAILDRLGLGRSMLERHPHQLSGGQKQRVCIARALLARPQIIVADEPTSALDVSVQAEIIALLRETIRERDMTMLFISHDLALVQSLCDRIYIFRNGRIEDSGRCDVIFSQSRHPYTRQLIEARPARFSH